MRDDAQRLHDVAAAIVRIEQHTQCDRAGFDSNELLQVWVVHHLQIIGEAVRGISDTTRDQHSEIPWKQIVGMRHILVHHYFGIDLETVWRVVVDDLPRLKAAVDRAIQGQTRARGDDETQDVPT